MRIKFNFKDIKVTHTEKELKELRAWLKKVNAINSKNKPKKIQPKKIKKKKSDGFIHGNFKILTNGSIKQ